MNNSEIENSRNKDHMKISESTVYILSVKLKIFSYLSILKFVLGAQKNRLDTVLLGTHNICFSR